MGSVTVLRNEIDKTCTDMSTTSISLYVAGSPVTALKNEIDRRLSMVNGDDLPLPVPISRADLKKEHQVHIKNSLAVNSYLINFFLL